MGEKKRRLAAARQPSRDRFDERLIGRAFQALQAGDRRAAETVFDGLLAARPRDPEALNAAGVLALQLGRAGAAEELLAGAVEVDERRATYRCHLAIAYRRLGKLEQAAAQLETALRLDPALAEAHSNLGLVLLDRAEYVAAARSFGRALAIRPDFPDALNGRGMTELNLGECARACADFERAVALDPAFHEAHYNLARARTQRVELRGASLETLQSTADAADAPLGLESILTALRLHRDNPAYWEQLERSVRNLDLRHPVGPSLREALLQALGHPAIDPARLVRPIASLATTHPAAVEIQRQLSASGEVAEPAWQGLEHQAEAVLGDALLQRLLEEALVPNLFVQRLLAFARKALLREALDKRLPQPSLSLRTIAAIAHQSFASEYVNEQSAAETAGVAQLRDAIAEARKARGAVPLHWYGVYACYRPLHSLDGAVRVAADLAASELRSLAVRQIEEPLEEARLRPTIAALTEVVDEVSVSVREQYEANPYPRWLRIKREIEPTTVAGFLRRLFPHADLEGIDAAPARILIAGCGSGRHPVGTAQRFPTSSLLAVDLSRTSLAYALRKTRELGIGNVQYRQADVLALGSLSERFDLIECSGVLHHLSEPAVGWRILCSLLRPGGLMRVGLYSETARRHAVRAREIVAALALAPTPEGIRACRRAILDGQSDPLLERVARGEDFYSLSGCRDLMFHVCERRFDLPQIARLLAELGLTFLGFELPDADVASRYRAQFPADRALSNLDHWHRFETANPDTFAQMYQFWVRQRS